MSIIDLIISSASEAFLWAIMAIGVYLMYRILDIADLSAEGVFPLGAAAAGVFIVGGINPIIAILLAGCAGGLAGLVGALIHTKLKIPALLTGILIMTGLYSVNIRIMGGPNLNLGGDNNIFKMVSGFIPQEYAGIFVGVSVLIIVIVLLYLFYQTELGLAFIATGDNEVMSRANSINTDKMKILGYMLANALIAISGSLIAQYNGFADVQSGVGTIVIGLAAVIIAGVVIKKTTFPKRLLSVVLGAFIYRLIISVVLETNIEAFDLKLISAIILTLFLYLPNVQLKKKGKDL